MTSLVSPIPDKIPERNPRRLKNQCNQQQWGINILQARINNKHKQNDSITSMDSIGSEASSFEMPSGSSSIFSVDRSENNWVVTGDNDNKEEPISDEELELFEIIENAEIRAIDGVETIVEVYCSANTEFNRMIKRLSYIEI